MKFPALFSPIQIGRMEVRNRLVMPSMGSNLADGDSRVTQRMVDYYAERARGGFGLITIEVTAVSLNGRSILREPGLWCDEQIEGYRKLADAIHAGGAKMSVQLHHAGRETVPAFTGNQEIVSCSPLPCPYCQVVPRELTTAECYEMIGKFVDAAERACRAGADAVEVHGAHGYLISQFMSSYTNRRADEFGGSFENRMRFPRLVVEGIRGRLGSDYPIVFRISGEEKTVGGRAIVESRAVARVMEEAGVNAMHVAGGSYASFDWVWGAFDSPPGYMTQFASEIKRSVSIPVITVGRINDSHYADELVASGRADMVSIGRQSIADPHFPNKALTGKLDEISPCIGCHQGCTEEMLKSNTITCVVNPFAGHEGVWKTTPAENPKTVMVVGGGPAGLEAAWILAKRGHRVSLYEKQNVTGGQFRVAAYPPGKGDLSNAVRYFTHMCEKQGVNMHLNTEADEVLIRAQNPDVILLATGGVPLIPPIRGIDNPNIVQANDLLLGRARAGGKVLIAGGGMVGVETADFLGEYGRSVTVVEMREKVGMDVNEMVAITLMRRLKGYGTAFVTGATITEFFGDGVSFEQNGETKELRGFDSVVLALGSKSYNPLEAAARSVCGEVYVLGDAEKAGKILKATSRAAELAVSI